MISNNKALLAVIGAGLMITAQADTKPAETKKVENKEVKAEVKQEAKAPEAGKKSSSAVTKDLNTNITIGDVMANANVTFDLNVRYVNTMEAMQTCKKGLEKSAELEKKREELSAEIKKYEQKVTQAMTEYKAKESTMSQSARNAEEAKIVEMRGELENLVKASETKLKLAMQQATEDLALDVETSIVELAEKEGYDIVTDVYTGRTLFASKKALVTEDLKKGMDKKYTSSSKPAVAA